MSHSPTVCPALTEMKSGAKDQLLCGDEQVSITEPNSRKSCAKNSVFQICCAVLLGRSLTSGISVQQGYCDVCDSIPTGMK